MAKYPIEKYNIIIHQHPDYNTTEIIAYSTYAGKVVKGKAICRLEDTYNEEKGKSLAIARCAAKIARKRKARAEKLVMEAARKLSEAQKYVADMTHYAADARQEVIDCDKEVEEILASM